MSREGEAQVVVKPKVAVERVAGGCHGINRCSLPSHLPCCTSFVPARESGVEMTLTGQLNRSPRGPNCRFGLVYCQGHRTSTEAA